MDSDSAAILFEARELPAKTVIVYADRAEVKREIEVDFAKKGTYTLLIQNLSPVIERQSIRVEGRRLAEISQVQYEEQPLTEQTTIHLEVLNQFEAEKLDKERQKIEFDDELHVLRKRLDVLDGVAGQVGQNALSIRDSTSSDSQNNNNYVHPSFLLCNEAMQNLGQFLEYYAKSASDLRHELREKETQRSNILAKIDMLERQIDQLRCRLEYDNHKRNLRVVVEVPEAGQAQIYLCYQVYCVSWRPSYDFRASTSQGASTKDFTKLDMDAEGDSDSSFSSQHSNLTSPNDAQIYYYGLIEQKTDESWENVELVLSTAQPCIAGTLPPLPTLTASFQKQPSLFRQRQLSAHRRPLNGSEEDIGIGSFEYECTDAAALQRLTIARSSSDSELNQNREQLPCSYFSIEQAATIPCDGQHHRVLIAHLQMQPQFMHETNPSKASSALLSALVVNTSQLPLLHGQASVFLNNSFICQSQLKTVLPGEQFCCALGVDASVKLEYKPAKRTTEKIGFMSKSSLTTHEQVISVRNAKVGERIHLTVREPIPKSVDDKIKVTILSPDLRTGRTEACLSKDNHLEWMCALEAGEQQDLCIKWTVECPLNESVVYATSSGITAGQPTTSHQYHLGSQQRVY
ncbi:Protein F37C4.5 [Aphelenchoides bicaudatus]|nr:Protein F37C4.5 [Aphelenchoides bicaudatus]